jgi:RND family efflux transporter MFP subunit
MHLTIRPVLLSLFILAACNHSEPSIKPVKQSLTEAVYASGVIKSVNQYQVFSNVIGIIKQINVKEGDLVKAGDVLMLLDNETVTLQKENALLSLENNSVAANKLKLEELKQQIDFTYKKFITDSLLFERQKSLYNQQIGSKADLEQKEVAFINSRSNYVSAHLRFNDFKRQVNMAEKQSEKLYAISKKQLGDFSIRSLINGRVYQIFKKPGEIVNQQTPVAIVGSANNFIIELLIDEYDIIKIKAGQAVKVMLDSYKGKLFDAVITKIYPIMNERSKSFLVEAAFKQQPEVLYPNLTVEANIIISQKENVLTIPRKYINAAGKIKLANGNWVQPKTGIKDYNLIEILDGINEETAIVLPTDEK